MWQLQCPYYISYADNTITAFHSEKDVDRNSYSMESKHNSLIHMLTSAKAKPEKEKITAIPVTKYGKLTLK
jgi:hypothetical protein